MTSVLRVLRLVVVLVLPGAALPGALNAQVNAPGLAGMRLDFHPAGARASALGGGALAATGGGLEQLAANPAALATLHGTRAAFTLAGAEREPGAVGNARHPATRSFVPLFTGVAHRLRAGDVVVALFRHASLAQRHQSASPGGVSADGAPLLPSTTRASLRLADYGVGMALPLGPAEIGITAGVSLLDFELNHARYRLTRYEERFLEGRLVVGPGAGSGGEGVGVFAGVGARVELADRLVVGAAYRLRPRFDGLEWRVLDSRGESVRDPAVRARGTFELDVPDTFGLGLALRVTGSLTAHVDAALHRYSQVAQGMTLVYGRSADGEELDDADYAADDGIDLSGGAEWRTHVRGSELALRLGAARRAASTIHYSGAATAERLLWGGTAAEPEARLTGGAGLRLANGLRLDAAFALGDQSRALIATLALTR